MITLPGTDLKIGRIALGTVKLGRNADVKYPKPFDLPTDGEVSKLLDTARSLGVNLIDTAPAYGISEQRLGQLLPGERSDWIISTKCGEQFDERGSHYDFSGKAARESIERSLNQLKTDYLDIVLIHSDGNDLDIIQNTDLVDTLQKIKAEGVIRYIGMSTKTIEGGLAALSFSDLLMVTLNLTDQTQLPVIKAAHEAGKGILLKKVFASGYQSAKESLGFAFGTEGVNAAVVGTMNPDHLAANVELAKDL